MAQSLRTTVDIMLSSRFGMCAVWGPDQTLIYNDAYAPILSARHPAALGGSFRDAWPDVWSDIEPLIEETMAGRAVLFEDMHLVMTRNGYAEDTWWTFSYSPLRDESGAIVGFLDVVVDSTAKVLNQRRLETESALLRESESRFRAQVNATSDSIYRMSPDWREMRALEGRRLPTDEDEQAARWLDVYVPKEDQPIVQAEIRRAIETKGTYSLEHRIRQADGSIGWALSRAVPVLDENGEIIEWFGTASDVTSQYEARAALAASKEKLELATRAARLGQFDFLPRTGALEWDDRCRELFGLPPDSPVSFDEAFVAGLHPNDRAGAVAAVEAALDPAGTHLFDAEYRTIGIEDHIERHIHAQGIAMFEDGVAVRLVGTVQDVTADRRAQAALRETEERLRLAVSATNDAIWDWDLGRDFVLWNDALESAYGHRLAQVEPSGAWWIGHIHPEDRDRIDHSIHAVIDGSDTDWTDEYRFRRADGTYADVKDRGYVIRDDSGRAIRMIGAMLDQTDRKEAERVLEHAKAKLEQTVEERTFERDQIWQSTPDLLCVVTADGWLKEINPAWIETLGWTEEELISRPFADYVHPDDVDRTVRATSEFKDGDSLFGFENRYQTKSGGYVWLNWNAVARSGLVYAVVRNVTAAHEQAEALAKAEDQLRQSQKMEAVGQLTGGIAHDFNNMLTGVIGSLELLKRYIPEGRTDKIERYIDAATTSAQRAAGLTQRLLAFSRRQSLDVQAVDVNHVVVGMEDLLRRTVGERIGLNIGLQAAGWNAVSDANQLESALLNLAINARDAMPEGGQLTIEGANIVLGADSAHAFEDFEPGDYVMLSVTDTGVGMSEEVMAKAFDPFFTTKPIGQGTGLGLSMIYGFARQTGGQVRIFSQVGRGTTVKLYLRRHFGEVEQVDANAIGQTPIGQGETVMVVEDDAAVRMLVIDVLEGLGYHVIHAADGRQAIRLLENAPPIGLLVTDVGLPGMNGRQVAELARKQRPDLKVLFVTGYAEQAAVRSSFLDEGMDMITKPFAVDALAEKVRGMIDAVDGGQS